jgi:hypothetical protein
MPQHAATNQGAPRPPGGRRASKAEVQRRLDHADKLLRDGKPRAEVVDSMVRTFTISVRAADSYIARVRERWAEESKGGRETERASTLARLDRLSGKAERRGSFAAAVSAEKLKAQVNGLLAPQAIEVKATVTQEVSAAQEEEQSDQARAEELMSIAWCLTHMMSSREVEVTPRLVDSARGLLKAAGDLARLVGATDEPALAPPRLLPGRTSTGG